MKPLPFRTLAFLALGFSILAEPPALHAGGGLVDPVVTNTNDDGPGSLRSAIIGSVPGSKITFNAALSGQTIQLTTGELLVPQSVTLDASALPNGITISGNNAFRVFHIAGAHTVIFDSLTITGGKAADGVAGILGGVGDSGGGIFNDGGTLTIRKSTIAGNRAGNGAVPDAAPGGMGGGIYNASGGILTIQKSTVSGNVSGEGADGVNTAGAGGNGGGIFNNGGTVNILNSTIANNVTGDGGDDTGTNTFNQPGGSGAGIYNHGSGVLTLENATITGNVTGNTRDTAGDKSGSGGGIFNNMAATTNLINSIVAENQIGTNGLSPDIFNSTGTINRFDFNLIGDNEGVTTEFPLPGTVGTPNSNGDFVGNSLNPFDPELGPLADSGGPTETRVPKADSPAIDVGAASRSFPTPFVNFTATLETITGTPFGLDTDDRTTVVAGAFAYDPTVADTNPTTNRGDYPQINGFFDVNLPGAKVTGSMTPLLKIEDFMAPTNDTFRFDDGTPKGRGVMSVNGTADNDVELAMSLTANGDTFSNDSLPDPFPFSIGSILFETFSLKDASGTVLLQFQTIEAGTPPVSDIDQRGHPRVAGAAIDLGAVERLEGQQPDIGIGKSSNRSTHKVDDFYTDSGAQQKLNVKLKGRSKMKFHTSVQNDGDVDTLRLQATKAKRGLVVKTFRLTGGRQNVTSALKGGTGYTIPDLGLGQSVTFQTQVKNKSGGKLRQTMKYTASSASDPTRKDVAKPKVIGK